MVENLPANAGDTGSCTGLGRSHMPRSNWAREPQLLSLRVCSLCSATREAAIMRGPRTEMKNGLRLPQLEKALAQKRRPNTAINKLKNKLKKILKKKIWYWGVYGQKQFRKHSTVLHFLLPKSLESPNHYTCTTLAIYSWKIWLSIIYTD